MDPDRPSSLTVEIIYYLSRTGHLDHPHLLQITTPPAHHGIRLQDFKKKLALIRGERLPSTYAWSYKRSYKKGYVWQDLCDEDLILPAQGCEYVLKGSEIIAGACSECNHVIASRGGLEKSGEHAAKQKLHRSLEQGAIVSMVESRMDASTQTEEDQHPLNTTQVHFSSSIDGQPRSIGGHEGQEHPTVLNNAGIASPALVSSPATRHANFTKDSVQDGEFNNHCQRPSPQMCVPFSPPPIAEEKDEAMKTSTVYPPASPLPSQKVCTPRRGGLSTCWHDNRVLDRIDSDDPTLYGAKPPRPKHSGALSLLQFISCGGIDIREDIAHMPVYSFSSTSSTPLSVHMPPTMVGSPSPEQLCEALGHNAGQAKIIKRLQSKKPAGIGDMGYSNVLSSVKPKSCNLPKGVLSHLNDGIPDIISISRMSISDRSTNVSRELDYQFQQQPKLPQQAKAGDEAWRCKGLKGSDRRRGAVSGEVHRGGSPLAMPGSAPASGVLPTNADFSVTARNASSPLTYSQHSHVVQLWRELSRSAKNIDPEPQNA